jgi:SPP1 gp7 family putative phage head morphogenesis protein
MQFWSAEDRRLWDTLAPLLLKIIAAGGVEAEAGLPTSLRVLVDWGLFNEKALDWLNKYQLTWIKGITETTRWRTVKAIDDWIRSGEKFDMLVARLNPLYDDGRARRIAVTEVTRVYAEGNKAAWRTTGFVSGNRWNTGNDELVCPVCSPLNGIEVGLDEGFTPEGAGWGPTAPPLHVNCRCYLSPVVDMSKAGDIIGAAIEEGE